LRFHQLATSLLAAAWAMMKAVLSAMVRLQVGAPCWSATMFKVSRAECLGGLTRRGDGFDLDIELACKLARNGNSPMEVPVNYAARGFADGKKIRFLRDAVPTYLAFFRYRFA